MEAYSRLHELAAKLVHTSSRNIAQNWTVKASAIDQSKKCISRSVPLTGCASLTPKNMFWKLDQLGLQLRKKYTYWLIDCTSFKHKLQQNRPEDEVHLDVYLSQEVEIVEAAA